MGGTLSLWSGGWADGGADRGHAPQVFDGVWGEVVHVQETDDGAGRAAGGGGRCGSGGGGRAPASLRRRVRTVRRRCRSRSCGVVAGKVLRAGHSIWWGMRHQALPSSAGWAMPEPRC